MEIFIEQGESKNDCMQKIAEKYKRPFHILSQKEIRLGGFLGLFSKPGVQVEFYFSPAQRSMSPAYLPGMPSAWYASDVQKQYAGESLHITRTDISGQRLEEEKMKVLAAAKQSAIQHNETGSDQARQILDALNELKEKVDKTNMAGGLKYGDHKAFVHARELLKLNDFSENYITMMLERLRKEIVYDQLDNPDLVQDHLLQWIGESISIYKDDPVMRKPRIMALIGPTGVGKTTTISKLAAIYGIGTDEIPAIEVRMITIDDFRICAKEQLEKTGNIMQIPVAYADSKQELRKEIALHSDSTDLFLVDTIGKSPKDSSKIGEMKEILEGAGRNAEFHLVIAASVKTKDIEDTMRQFEPFNYKSVILSKMDETTSVGNIISALAEKRKSVSFVTIGQNLPEDIRRASVVRFLINLEGFKVNRDKMERLFPSGEADQFKWR
ncbi:MAG: flagellar biosynthesis protein FlhF [Treponema sp.]|jgi:flagellar biosynthesis protein FlhF|nr:flagellar biosynthesis protein FlhF [Treponema sp.]